MKQSLSKQACGLILRMNLLRNLPTLVLVTGLFSATDYRSGGRYFNATGGEPAGDFL